MSLVGASSAKASSAVPHGDGCQTCHGLQISRGSNWCPGQDSNLHALRHGLLRPACLPFHHPGDGDFEGGVSIFDRPRQAGKTLEWPTD